MSMQQDDELWLMELFAFEDCEECGAGAEGHKVVYGFPFPGNKFAQCVPEEERGE